MVDPLGRARRVAYDGPIRLPARPGTSRPLGRHPPADPRGRADTTRTWASWRATAAETRAAPRTLRQPGEIPVPPTRRPPPVAPDERSFRDSGWAALIVALVILGLLAAAIVAGKLAAGA